MNKYKGIKYYIDMDGVLAKWNASASEEETHEVGYFRDREVETEAVALVKMLMEHGHQVFILSSVYEDDHSFKDKIAWLTSVGLENVPRIFVPYGEDKYKYVSDCDCLPVLVDDYSRNLIAWEERGYMPVKFFNGINNNPKLCIDGNVITVKTDSWGGYSIDHRMSAKQMFNVVTSVAKAEIEVA